MATRLERLAKVSKKPPKRRRRFYCPGCKKNREYFENGVCEFCFHDVPVSNKKNMVEEVDADMIRRLRFQGKGWEATQMVKAYQKNKKKNKEQLRLEIKKINSMATRIMRKNMGACVACGERAPEEGLLQCAECNKLSRERNRKSSQK